MHMVIRAIVYAKDEDDALLEANRVFENITGEGQNFDYFALFSESFATERWGELPVVSSADSKEGKKLINEGMESSKKVFMESIKNLRTALAKFSDEKCYLQRHAKFEEEVRYQASRVGSYGGSEYWLYDQDGEAIRTPSHLKDVLGKWKSLFESLKKENPHKGLKVWVVPADVHY